MEVDQTRSQLEASRESFEKAAVRLVKQQQEIATTIGDMTRLSLTSANLQQMLPILTKPVGTFTRRDSPSLSNFSIPLRRSRLAYFAASTNRRRVTAASHVRIAASQHKIAASQYKIAASSLATAASSISIAAYRR
ncbi:hypothetical protein B0H19DRAFT_1273574 [Mycena capillaripes]|nr:hypothetical protein B0H19DRAFT_1273574 [Mycena capillaripes]